MEAQAILDLYDQEMRQDAPANRANIYKRPGLTYFLAQPPSPRAGWVIYTRLDAASVDEAISATVDFFSDKGEAFEWKVYDHDTPHDLKDRLLGRGFEAEDLEAVLAFDMERAPRGFWEPSAVTVRRITDPKELAAVTQVESEVWGEPHDVLEAALAEEMKTTPDQLSVYLAYAGDEAACSAWIRYYPGSHFAELYGGATLPAQRGKGLYKALVQARAKEAKARGVRFLVVDTSPMSGPILQRHGFVFLTHAQGLVMDFSKSRTAGASGP
jgi:ribosomal protein S18 acetylase RimI-like enzyme